MSKERVSGLDPNRLPDLVLVNSPLRDYAQTPKSDYEVLPPLGLAHIATEAKRGGFNVGLVDSEHYGLPVDEIVDTLNCLSPRLVGLNVLTPTREVALMVAAGLDFATPLVIGGPHATAMPEETIREFSSLHPQTVLVRGEAETVVRAMLDGQPWHDLAGVWWMEGEKVRYNEGVLVEDIGRLAVPDRGFLPNEPSLDDRTGKLEARVLTSRGCCWNCSFCAGAREMYGLAVRRREAASVAGEVAGLVCGGVEAVRMVDDLFLASFRQARSVFEPLADMGISLKFDATGRANILARFKPEEWDMLGVWMNEIALGIESGSARLRERIDKRVTEEEITATLEAGTRRGINFKGYFIIGLPTETREETRATIDLAKGLVTDYPGQFRASIFRFRPYPGTGEWNWLISQGYKIDDLLDMHADGTGERAKHEVSSRLSFGGCSPVELGGLLRDFNAWQEKAKRGGD